MEQMSRRLPPLVLSYHGIGRPSRRRADPHGLLASEKSLRRHLRILDKWGYELVTFGTLAARVRDADGRGSAAITFDDGLANLSALPAILEPFGGRATVFAVATWLDAPHPDLEGARTLDADGLRALAGAGIEIGSHSRTHPDLQAVGYEAARAELADSKATLEAMLQRPVDTAAYPYGRADEDTRRACRDSGYVAACRTAGQGTWSDPFDLPRQDMNDWSNRIGLRLKRDDRYESVMRWAPARAMRLVGRLARGAA
jgi:peptidoglycan/xylan/chitin deacetylase (PgdA/CDA1 family)